MDKIVGHHSEGLSNTILRAENFVFVLFWVCCEDLFLYENDQNMVKVRKSLLYESYNRLALCFQFFYL